MSFRTNALKVQAFAGAVYGIQVGTTTMAQINADITSAGSLSNALNGYYTSSFGSVANATVATTVATNLGLTGDALTSGAAYITAQLNAASAGERGAVISNILDLFAGLASDATFGAFATAYNTKVDAAVAYTGTANVAIGTVVADSDLTFTITADTSVYTGGTGDDTFTGAAGVIDGATINAGAGDDSLTLSLSDADDGSSFVATGLENMTVRLLSSATAGVAIDLSEVTGLETLTARRVSDADTAATLADLTFENIQDTDVVLTMQTISADGIIVEFDFDNTVVTGTADSVTLQIDSVTATATAASAWIDGDIETINVVAVGEGNVLSLQAAGADTLVVSGGEIEFASALSANIVSVDASANTGGVTLELGTATASVAVTGGDGDDSIDASAVTATTVVVVDGGDGADSLTLIAAQIVEGLSFTGGNGADTLTVSVTAAVAAASTTTTAAVVDGVETIALVINDATAAVDLGAFRDISGVETIEVSFDTANTIGALAIDGLDGQSIEIDFAGAATSTNTVNATLTVTVGATTATTTTTSTADVRTVAVVNSATATTASGAAGSYNLDITLDIDGVETINLSGDSAAGELDVTLVADALKTLNVAAAAAMTVSLTAAAITDVVLTGAGDVTLAATVADFDVDASDLTGGLTYEVNLAATAADVIVITGGAGDDAITVDEGRYTVDLGAGDDTLTLSALAMADLTSRDSFNGGDGTDTVDITLATGGNDLNLVGFEVLALSAASNTATATIDRLTSLTSIQVDASSTADVVIQDLAVSSIDLDVTALDGTSSLSVALLDDTDTDTAAIVIAGTATVTAGTVDIGTITLNGFDTISLDLTITDESTAATTTVISASANIEAISSDSAVSFVLTGDDDNLNVTVAMTLDLADGAVIDLTGFGGNIGNAASATSTGTVTGTNTGGTSTFTVTNAANGISLDGANSYTILLGDEAGADVVIDLGLALSNTGTAATGVISIANEGSDIIEFVDLGDTDDIGSVVIVNFNDRTNFSLSQASVIDLSDLSVTGLSELDITGTADAVITFDDLTGSITLVGVNSADLTAANFIFA